MKRNQIAALLLVAGLVASLGAAAVGATAASSSSSGDGPYEAIAQESDGEYGDEIGIEDDSPDEADEVYVSENGDAVLVYEEDHNESEDANVTNLAGEFGLAGDAGLLHLLYSGELENESELTGSASAQVTPESIATSGDVTGEKPDDLVNLSVDAASERTRSTANSHVDVSMVVENETGETDQFGMYDSVEGEANTTVTASTYESSGEIATVTNESMVFGEPTEEKTEVTLTEVHGGYELVVEEDRSVSDRVRENWEDRESALESLEGEYGGMAMEFGGTADVELEDHEFEEGEFTHTASLEYTVTFEDVKDQVADRMADELADQRDLDLDEQESQRIADRIAKLRIERVHFESKTDGTEQKVEWDVQIKNYDEFVLGLVEIAESVEEIDDEVADEYDNVSAMIDAQNAAELEQTSSWEFAYETDGARTSYEFHSESDTENWGAFVDELEERGLDQYVTETTTEFSAHTDGEDLTTAFAYEIEREGWLDESLESAMAEAEAVNETDDVEAVDEYTEFLTNVQQSEFETARANVSFDEDDVTVRSAARFGNLSAFDGYPIETDDNVTVTDIYGETENGTTTTYVTVESFVDADASESEVREHDRVGNETEVHMPGEWDREFPSIDVESVNAYLEEDDDSLLPVGIEIVGLALVALIAVGGAAVAVRRL